MKAIVIGSDPKKSKTKYMAYVRSGKKNVIEAVESTGFVGKRRTKSKRSGGKWLGIRFKKSRKKTDIYIRIGNNIRLLREAAQMTLKELAHASGISVSFLTNIENSTRRPTFYTIEKLAHGLDTDIRDIIGMEAIENPIPEEMMLEFQIRGLVQASTLKERKRIWKYLRKNHRK